MTEKYQPIPHRLKNMAVGGHVAGAVDIVDDNLRKTQQTINSEVNAELSESRRVEGTLDERLDAVEEIVQISLDGGEMQIVNDPTDVSLGGGKIPTENALANIAGTYTENDEFVDIHVDSSGKYLYGVKKNGDFDWQSGIPTHVKNSIKEGGYEPVDDIENRVEICYDKHNKLVNYRRKDGVLVECAGIKTPKVILDNDGIQLLANQLKVNGFSPNSKRSLGILVIGSSGEQSYVPYLPPVLDEILNDYNIVYGNMYSSGADAADYVEFYKNNTPCAAFNIWKVSDKRWTVYTNSFTLEKVLAVYNWNIILFKGSITASRELMRIIQSLVTYPVNFVTDSRYSRLYDRGEDTSKDIDDVWESITIAQNAKVKTTGFMDTIPIGTAIENTRHNNVLKKAGVTWAEPKQVTIPAGKYLTLQQYVRGASVTPTLKARRISGTGEVIITLGSYDVFTLNDNEEHTTTFTDADTDLIRFTNNGTDDCTVEFVNEDSIGNYLLYDDQHLQSGLAQLVAAYTFAFKILQWTGNSHRGVYASSFIPRQENITSINIIGAHGLPCGIIDYLGSDDNHYDASQLIDAGNGTYYVAESVFNGVPDENSITATPYRVLYENMYAAQEIAAISVGNPNELTDVSEIIISNL